jgi:hypothetical protein
MGQRSHANYAATRDAQTMLKMDKSVLSMGQRSKNTYTYAAVRAAQNILKKEDCA